MKRGYLSQYFESVAAKRLSAVEADTETSNQHEFNGTKELKLVLGEGSGEKITFSALFLWLGTENEGISSEGFVTWYDARRDHPTRSEYRLYFSTTDVSRLARANDMMFIAKRTDGSVMVIITANGSTIENQLFWLFDLPKLTGSLFEFSAVEKESDIEIDFAARFILDELGIEVEEPDADRLDGLLQKFYGVLPSTNEFSTFARNTLRDVNSLEDPDAALISWMEQEEKLFRRLERQIVSQRLQIGFVADGAADVDGFISFSLSVQNRRKARVGYALEHHVEEILKTHDIKYEKGGKTEVNKKPDFLFPRSAEYADPNFPSTGLNMLGVKTTLKDRWRQVLSEANRIKSKHLLTLEPGVSENQTDEMLSFNLLLVVPKSLHETYTIKQKSWLMNMKDFITTVKKNQQQ